MSYFWLSLQRTFQFSGRAQRAEYWYFMLFTLILFFISGLVPILGLIFLPLIITQISLSVRRLHDINLSGWWAVLFIPLSIPMLIVGLIDSGKDNQYGVNPKKQTKTPNTDTVQPEIKDFHYSSNPSKTDTSAPSASQPRLPLKDFN